MQCECGRDGFICEQCGRVQCMTCFRHYSWQESSRLCWQCQNEADLEALHSIVDSKSAKSVVWRKWPRGDNAP